MSTPPAKASITSVLFAVCTIVAQVQTRADSPVPVPPEAGRYAALVKHSPFAVASAAEAAPAPQGSFADNWFISGVGCIGDQNFATVRSRDLSHQFTLFTGETEEGVSLVEVNWSDEIGKSTIVLQKGTETAKLEFSESQLRSTVPTVGTVTTTSPSTSGPNPKPISMPPLPTSGKPSSLAPSPQTSPLASADSAPSPINRRLQVIHRPR